MSRLPLLVVAALAWLPPPALCEPGAGSDAAFVAELEPARRAAQEALAGRPRSELSLAPLFTTPAPTRAPSVSDLARERLGQTAALVGGDLYFVDHGYAFKKAGGTGAPEYLRSDSAVKALLAYKGALVAVMGSGGAALWNEPERAWILIPDRIMVGDSIERLLVDGDDLVGRTARGELVVRRGEPGPLAVTWKKVPVPHFAAKLTIVLSKTVPVANGRDMAFPKASLAGVADIGATQDGAVLVAMEDGSVVPYAALRDRLGAPAP